MRTALTILEIVAPVWAILLVVLYAPFVLSGRISREEEADELRHHFKGPAE